MKPFRYLGDRLAIVAIVLYAANRWLLKPHLDGGFMHDQFNDLLLIPAALPVMLWLHRQLGWRTHDRAPTWTEVSLHLVVWTLLCEVVGPRWVAHATADWRDAVAYLAGAIIAGGWWQRRPPRTAAGVAALEA